MPSFELYKSKYKKNNVNFIYKKKKISQISLQIKIKTKNKKKSRFKILFLAGTHDIKDIYNYSLKLTKVNKNITAYIKTHPKNKFNFDENGKIKKISSFKRKSFDKVFVSSTSTIAYDLSILNKKFESFKPDYKSC